MIYRKSLQAISARLRPAIQTFQRNQWSKVHGLLVTTQFNDGNVTPVITAPQLHATVLLWFNLRPIARIAQLTAHTRRQLRRAQFAHIVVRAEVSGPMWPASMFRFSWRKRAPNPCTDPRNAQYRPGAPVVIRRTCVRNAPDSRQQKSAASQRRHHLRDCYHGALQY